MRRSIERSTSEILSGDALAAHSSPQEGRVKSPSADYPKKATAVHVRKPYITVATVMLGHNRQYTLLENQCAILTIENRSSNVIREIYQSLYYLFDRHDINEVLFRKSNLRGPYVQHPFAFKVETAIQLIPEMTVGFVSGISVDGWISRERPYLPVTSGHRLAYAREAQRKAIDTAVFGIAMAGNSRYIQDGSGEVLNA